MSEYLAQPSRLIEKREMREKRQHSTIFRERDHTNTHNKTANINAIVLSFNDAQKGANSNGTNIFM